MQFFCSDREGEKSYKKNFEINFQKLLDTVQKFQLKDKNNN